MAHQDGIGPEVTAELERLRQRVAQLTEEFARYKDVEASLGASEETFKILAEQSPNMVFVYRAGRIIYANQQCQRVTGYSQEELGAATLSPGDLVTSEDRPLVYENFRRNVQGEEVDPYEARLLTKDGQLIDAVFSTRAIDYQGERAILGTVADISERIRTEREVEERRLYLEGVLSSAPDAIITLDAEHRVVEWNPGAERLFGYTREEAIGRDIDPLITNQHTHGEAFEFTHQVLSGHTLSPVETVRYHKDGTPVDVMVTGSPILVGDELIGVVAIYTDISERKQAMEEIRSQAEMLEALHETALGLASQRDLTDLLEAVVARAVHLLEARGGGIYLYRPDSDDLEFVLTHNLEPDRTGAVLQRGEGLSGKVLESGRSMSVDNYSTWEERAAQFEDAGFAACVAVPIVWGDRLLGVLNVLDDPPRVFSDSDIAILERVVLLTGAAMEQTRLLEETRERWREAETLRQAGAAVAEVLSLDERLECILEQLGRVLPYDSASVQLLREGTLEIVGGRGFPDLDAVVGLEFPMPGDNPNTQVVEERRPILLDDAQTAHPPFRQPPHNHIRSWLGVPLIVHDRVIGLLAVDSTERGHFNQAHIRLVIPFADQVAVALENARLYSDLQQQMEELKSTQAQLVQSAKLAAVGEMAAGVAHELNNPLTSVLGYAEIAMSEMPPGDPHRKDLEQIISEALRAHEIVRNLLNFSRQTGPLRQSTDLNQILHQTLAVIRYHLETSGLSIEEDYDAEIGQIYLDPGQIKQVFLNLLTNAYQAMPEGGALSIRTARVGEEAAVSITDTGAGILPENLERIFDPFFSTKSSGTGLGLSVSLGIVQRHGGRIEVESTPGQGSTFTVWLPLEQRGS